MLVAEGGGGQLRQHEVEVALEVEVLGHPTSRQSEAVMLPWGLLEPALCPSLTTGDSLEGPPCNNAPSGFKCFHEAYL